MEDFFEKMMERFLIPVRELRDGPSDAMYFLHLKGGLVYSEGYEHPPGGLYASLIKYPDPEGHIVIFGKRFNWTHRRYENGKLTVVPYDEQVRRQKEILPELRNRPPAPPFAGHFCHYLLSEMRGYFDSRKSLMLLMESSPRLAEVINSLDDLLGVPVKRLGCNGSLAYGYFEEPQEDVDVIFFGSVKENFRVLRRIRELKKREPERECYELGKIWPLRFGHMGTIICPFFKYSVPDEIPLRNFSMDVLKKSVSAEGVVVDDLHTAYLPAILTLDGVTIDGKAHKPLDLVIYDGSQRGEYYKNHRLRINGGLVKIHTEGKAREALLVTMPGEVAIVSSH